MFLSKRQELPFSPRVDGLNHFHSRLKFLLFAVPGELCGPLSRSGVFYFAMTGPKFGSSCLGASEDNKSVFRNETVPQSTVRREGRTPQLENTTTIAFTFNKEKEPRIFKDLLRAAEEIPHVSVFCLSLPSQSISPSLQLPAPFEGSTHSDSVAQKYDAILHKRTEDMATIAKGRDIDAELRLHALHKALHSFDVTGAPVASVDSYAGVWRLVDRASIYTAVDDALSSLPRGAKLAWTIIPVGDAHDREMVEAAIAGLRFPIILKSRIASGSKASHEMAIAYDLEGAHSALEILFEKTRRGLAARSFSPSPSPEGCTPGQLVFDSQCVVAQEYIPEHGGLVFKLYAVGETIVVRPRASVTGSYNPETTWKASSTRSMLEEGRGRFFMFNSQNVDKGLAHPGSGAPPTPSEDMNLAIVRALGKELGLTLMGIDMIYDLKTDAYSVVDINYFPGYHGVPGLHRIILEHVHELVQKRRDSSRR